MSIFCKLGFHEYQETADGIHWRLAERNQWQRCHFGWEEFRKCSKCGKMQFREIRTSYGRILSTSNWLGMNESAKNTLEIYKNYNK